MGRERGKALFCYGTLMDPEVRAAVLGPSATRLEAAPARLDGYRRVRVSGASYPVLRAALGDSVSGCLLDGLSEADLARIVRFEGPEYEMATREVMLAGGRRATALVFLPREGVPMTSEPWDLETWRRCHKAAFLRRETGAAGEGTPGRD